jgi:hypothetical protein
MRCRGVHNVAKDAFLRVFPFSGLLRIAPYCAPGGIRVASKMPFFLVVRGALGVTQSTFLHLSQIVHRNVQARGA